MTEQQQYHHHYGLVGCTLNPTTHVLTGERTQTQRRRPCWMEAEIRVTLPGAKEGEQRLEGRREACDGASWSPQKGLALLTSGLRYLASRLRENERPLFSATGCAALCHSSLGSLLRLLIQFTGPVHLPQRPSSHKHPLHCQCPHWGFASNALCSRDASCTKVRHLQRMAAPEAASSSSVSGPAHNC